MARPIACDNEDGQPAAYVITNTADGSTFAVCIGDWIQLCAQVATEAGATVIDPVPATAPAPIDPPADPSDPDNDTLVSDQATARIGGVAANTVVNPDGTLGVELVDHPWPYGTPEHSEGPTESEVAARTSPGPVE